MKNDWKGHLLITGINAQAESPIALASAYFI